MHRKIYIGRVIALLLACFIVMPALSQAPPHGATIPYKPLLSGVANFTLRSLITEHAQLFSLIDQPTYTVAEIKQRATHDMKSVVKALNMQGYYNAQVDYSINYTTTPITVNFMVNLGEIYAITEFSLSATTLDNVVLNHIIMNPAMIGIQLGQAADLDHVKEAIKKLFIILGDNGYPYAKIKHEQVIVDHAKKGMNITLFLDTGRLMHFGENHFTLAPGMDKKFIEARLQWKKGEVYSNIKVMQTVEVLNNTHQYSYVKIGRPPTIPNDEKVHMLIEAAPSSAKDVSWEFGHSGNLKFGGAVGWKGTNILGDGDFMEVKGYLGQHKTGLLYEHIIPDIFWPESSLTTKVELVKTKWEAFKSFGTKFSSIITTPIVDTLFGYAGYMVNFSDLKALNGTADHAPLVMSLPIGVHYDWFDDPRFPRKGWGIHMDIQPSMQVAPNKYFFQANIEQSVLYPLTADKRLILSGWYNIGMSPGAGKSVLPMDRRYYAGGLGTVRGFGSQMAGPLNDDGKPLGGRSMMAFGSALTYHLNQDVAVTGFVDVGSTYASNYPNFAHRLFVGVGGGVKYKTMIGDIHVDVAFPVNRRPEDQKAQIYFGIDQPF